jgi:methyl-accepting chemotaxis protein
MFSSNNKNPDYRKISLDEFSDDSSEDEQDFVNRPSASRSSSNHGHYSDDAGGMQRQQQLMQQQDHGLEMLAQSAERLGNLSMAISDELNQQNQMLDDMDRDLDEAGNNLDYVTQKTKEFIEQSGGMQNFMLILTLIVIAIVLFLLILYT